MLPDSTPIGRTATVLPCRPSNNSRNLATHARCQIAAVAGRRFQL